MCVCAQLLSHVQLFAVPWTVSHQAPLPMEFSRQEYWSGAPFPTPGHLFNPGIQPMTLVFPALVGGFFTTGATCKALDAAKYPAVTRTASPQYELFNSKHR